MPRFDTLFMESKGQPIIYKGKTVVGVDRFPVHNSDILVTSIEEANGDRRQGFVIDVKGHCKIDGEVIKTGKGVRMLFWQDTMPKEVQLEIFTKKDFITIYNIWESPVSYLADGIRRESTVTEYFTNGSAMIVEEIENGRRYYCNDGEPDEDFDDIIFTVRKL